MDKVKCRFGLLTSLCFFCLIPSPQALKTANHVKASLVSEVKSIQPGTPFWVGIHLQMQPHWHTYWKNAGESGAPTQIEWRLPIGFKAGSIQWPYPRRIAVPPIVSYGYENEVLLLARLEPPRNLKNGQTIPLSAHVDWLECETVCIPGSAEASLTWPVKNSAPEINTLWQEKFSNAHFEWPLEKSEWTIRVFDSKNHFQIRLIPPPDFREKLTDVSFFAEEPNVINYGAFQKMTWVSRGYTLDVFKSEASTETPKILKGVLVTSIGWRGPNSEKALRINSPIEPATAKPLMSLLLALGFSFLGGLILNLMPCVLPVLAIKILGFINQARENRRHIFQHGLVFAIGVVISFWILAGALLFLRAGGEQLGWGFQLQSPGFVAFLAVLFLVLALNLFGVFEIGTSLIQLAGISQQHTGYAGSFLNGALATIVATPCTAPFMGPALGFALTQPPAISLLIFTSLGLGMAAPYLVLSAHPALLRFVPKPGPWMNSFKKIMGLLFLGTVFWLAWVLAQQLSLNSSSVSLAMKKSGGLVWEPYSEERVVQLRKQGRAVFVDFTAAWCLTCQVNERLVFHNQKVVKAFKVKNVATLKADWTSRDEKISRKLEEFGRSGVPFYLLYPANSQQAPEPLPEIITPQIVLNALEKL